MKPDWMLMILGGALLLIVFSFWRAHIGKGEFDAFDIIMENGRVSKIAVAFMLVLGVTTWVIIDLQIKGALTEGYFTVYGTMWVVPLVAKVVFNKADAPAGTTITTEIKSTEKTTL